MARLSDEAKKDRKVKIVVGLILFVIIGFGFGIGPGLPRVLDHAREHRTEPWAAQRYLHIAFVMEMTFREDKAMEIYDEFYLLWGGKDWEEDFSEVLGELHDNEHYGYYFPQVNARYDGFPGIDEDDPDIVNRRPAPLSDTRHPLFGQALIKRAKYFEGQRLYSESRPMFACLFFMWPPGSPEHTEGEQGRRRAALRSF